MKRYSERIDFTLPVEAKERLRKAADGEGISVSEAVRRRIRAFMETEAG